MRSRGSSGAPSRPCETAGIADSTTLGTPGAPMDHPCRASLRLFTSRDLRSGRGRPPGPWPQRPIRFQIPLAVVISDTEQLSRSNPARDTCEPLSTVNHPRGVGRTAADDSRVRVQHPVSHVLGSLGSQISLAGAGAYPQPGHRVERLNPASTVKRPTAGKASPLSSSNRPILRNAGPTSKLSRSPTPQPPITRPPAMSEP